MTKFFRPLVLCIMVLVYVSKSYAFTAEEKLDVLQQLMDIQNTRQNKDNIELQILIDALVSSIYGTNIKSKISRSSYERALEHQIELQEQDPDNSTVQIVVESLIHRISQFPKKSKTHVNPQSDPINSQDYINDDEAFNAFVASTKEEPFQCGRRSLPLIRESQVPRGLDQIIRSTNPIVDSESRLNAREKMVSKFFRDNGLEVSAFNNWTRRNYQVNVDRGSNQEGRKTFLHYWNRGDGDCALHGMSKSREDFVRLVSQSYRSNPALRSDLRDGVYSYCSDQFGEERCQSILNPRNDRRNARIFQQYISNRLSNQDEYLSFGLTGRNKPVGLLAAAAKVFKENVRVWRAARGGNLEMVFQIRNNLSDKYIDLLHSGSHFDRLIEEKDTLERANALEKELQFARELIE